MDRRAGYVARIPRLLAFALVGVLLLQGCDRSGPRVLDPAMPPPGQGPFTGTVADWPLWFIWHNFGSHCFDVQECRIIYAGRAHGVDKPKGSLESLGRPIEHVLSAGRGPIQNFPPPAAVTWISKDGTPLEASVDIAEIFADRRVRHTVARDDILEKSYIPRPGIILVVDDRTVSVYMRTWIPLKGPQRPGYPSPHQVGVVQAYSQTY